MKQLQRILTHCCMGDWGMARAWRLWEPHEGEDSVVLECVSGHEKRRKGGGRCCWAVGFWGVVWGGGSVRWNMVSVHVLHGVLVKISPRLTTF